jgi:hypothetical protein
VLAGHKVLMNIDYILLCVGNPQGILDQLLKPRPIHTLNFIIILINVSLYIIKFKIKSMPSNRKAATDLAVIFCKDEVAQRNGNI